MIVTFSRRPGAGVFIIGPRSPDWREEKKANAAGDGRVRGSCAGSSRVGGRSLWAQAPGGEEGQEVGGVDIAIAVHIAAR